MARRYDKGVSGSVQARNGYLHLVVGYKDPLTQKRKVKWMAMDLPEDSLKSVVEKRKRDMITEFEAKYARLIDGYDDPENYPFVAFMHEWLDEVHRHKVQESTYLGYKARVSGHMTKFFGDKMSLADLKPRVINSFYDYLRSMGDSEQTVLHYHNLLHSMFEYAIKQELFEFNPMQRVDRPTVKRYSAGFYSAEEVQTLLAFAKDDPLYIPIVLAVYCGMRRSEALGMTWDCVDFENDKISVQKKVIEISKNGKKQIIVSDELKTESSRRVFAMHPDVKKILLKHKEQQEVYRKQFKRSYSKKYLNMVCVDQLGDLIRPNFVTEHFNILLKKHNLRKIRFHDLRHTFATTALANGMDIKTLSSIIGHVSSSTTLDIYLHSTDKMQKEAARSIDRGIRGVSSEEKTSEELNTDSEKTAPKQKFEPVKGKYRKPGTGCVSKINDNLWEGRYTPTVNGKRMATNIYANSEEECEAKLAELIREMKIEIEKLKQGG